MRERLEIKDWRLKRKQVEAPPRIALNTSMLCSEKVYSIDDLRTWTRTEASFAVLGKPIAHSLSPKMHNAAFAALQERYPHFARYRYFRFEIAPEALDKALPLFFEKACMHLPHPGKDAKIFKLTEQ